MKYILRNKQYKFELASIVSQKVGFIPKDFKCRTDFINIQSGYLTVRKRYAWDGSSIPAKRFMQRITFGKYDPDRYCKDASLVHDAMYQLMRLNKLDRKHKDTIDRLYEKMCIEGATKIIHEQWASDREKILELVFRGLDRKLNSLARKNTKKLKKLPAWAARRYWAVHYFGARTLNPRHYPEKRILET